MPDGQLDQTFGRVVTDFGGRNDTSHEVLLRSDGTIMLLGSTTKERFRDFAMARYTIDPMAVERPDLQATSDGGWSPVDNVTGAASTTFDVGGVAPHASLMLFRDGTLVKAIADAGTGGIVSITDAGPIAEGVHVYIAQQLPNGGTPSPLSPPLSVRIDRSAPLDVMHGFRLRSAPMSMTFQWNEDLGPTISASDLLLENLSTGLAVPTASLALSYDALSHIATYRFPGFAHGILPDGDYRATIRGADVADAAGNAMSAESILTCIVRRGDDDGNGVVDFGDYALIDFGFNNHLSGWGNGDFNGDGVVNFDDYSLIDFAFNQNVAAKRPLTSPAKLPSALGSPHARLGRVIG
jgi:hypothetical protein